MTEKQTIRESLTRKMNLAAENGYEESAQLYRDTIDHLDKCYRDDTHELTAKDPYNKPENVIEGKEVRIGEE